MKTASASPIKTLRRALTMHARADFTFFLMPPLMLLLIAGTLAQRPLGLYEATQLYFSSFIFWAGPVPLPAGYTLLGLLTFGLTLKFLLHSQWHRAKAGINLTHLGALVLLIGGLFTALTAREGYMAIPEGGQSPYVYDYFGRSLYIFADDQLRYSVDFETLEGPLTFPGTPFGINVLSTCENCDIQKREDNAQDFDAETLRNMAQFMALEPKPKAKEAEENLSGLTFEITGLDEAQNGTYIGFEGMPKPIELKTKNTEYKIIFGKDQRLLPFEIRLNDFVKDSYPGTNKARGFHSDIIVIDNGAEWPYRIAMNEPLRYKGYTFYQSSFERTEEMEVTVLSVVENKGRIFPYIGTLIIALGLLLHLFILAKAGRKT